MTRKYVDINEDTEIELDLEDETQEVEIENEIEPIYIPGPKWKDGKDGRDGINGKDGKDGKEWKAGTPGRDGKDGKDWQNGKDGQNWKDGKDGEPGENGKSAYEQAVENGFTGTLEEWLRSLKWKDGKDGKDGRDGRPGDPGPRGPWVIGPAGASAYEIAVKNGFVGTEQEWLDSLAGGGVNKNYFDFVTNPTGVPTAEGVLSYNPTEKTLDLQQGNGVIQQIGQEQYWRGKNQTGATIANGSIVFANGALGASGIMTIGKYIADGSISAMYVLGITTEDIANGSDWFITTFGKIRGIDTTGGAENWQEWDVLYASTSTAGVLTNVEPAFPLKRIPIAFVINRHAVNGTLAVRVPTPDQTAEEVGYDNTISGLVSNNVKSALDELKTEIDNISLIPGPQGPQWEQGIQGIQGPAGTNWTNWTNGVDGVDGITPKSPGGITIDGGGSVITTGSKGYARVPNTGTITGYTLLAKESGDIIMDVKKWTFGSFPATSSITGTEKPTLSGAQSAQDTNLTTWNTSVNEGDILEFTVESVATITRVSLFLHLTPL